MTRFTLEDLEAIVDQRATSDDELSYTRKLIGKGVAKCAQKVGEEAVEAAIAAVKPDKQELTGEAADLLYHLLVLLKVSDVPLADVMATLQSRTAQTGLQEKASRASD
ncbi:MULTISPECIES: phosphoribosyl-ATP diphosphatase [Pseudovibrio]|uniref:phosphoribosyl-ATP diphosphatase n=1 Tax=Stappiaceae TaxID=2821832 RepID=UPI002365B96C|nr:MULTISPECIES: phosphoribosyl-ATP diphosphatase [Pseudovibrio]MDD7909714.1 phosphoribosyl-ATP diphosphatase [Pseudovibrio exalbescens]MDX5592056.1 phosphoribosyl-ATP diphosphatase [Pseudovibrio sp. SPO723]